MIPWNVEQIPVVDGQAAGPYWVRKRTSVPFWKLTYAIRVRIICPVFQIGRKEIYVGASGLSVSKCFRSAITPAPTSLPDTNSLTDYTNIRGV